MPGFPFTVATVLTCVHQAPAVLPSTQAAVSMLGTPVVTAAGQIARGGLPVRPGGRRPTLHADPLDRRLHEGDGRRASRCCSCRRPGPGSVPVCASADQAPQGTPDMKSVQMKVTAT